jgi:MFS family permease
MNSLERKAITGLASIYAVRMLGLFLLLPILALYANELTDASPFYIGIALGIYGLAQASLQIPFGMLSDRFSRKHVITFGLLLFILGSIIAALWHSIYGIILGRALQGAGAISGVVLAMTADLTQEKTRTLAMAIIGMSIGLTFFVAMWLAPILHAWVGVSGIFWLSAFLALVAIVFLYWQIPTPPQQSFHRDVQPVVKQLFSTITHPNLSGLIVGIFILHAILTASFLAIPLLLKQAMQGSTTNVGLSVYLPILITTLLVIFPALRFAERKQKTAQVFQLAIVCIIISQIGFLQNTQSLYPFALYLLLFFCGFTLLETLLPSLISKAAPLENKGTAMGAYSTSQYLGIFAGGAIGGWVFNLYQTMGIFLLSIILAAVWLIISVKPSIMRSLLILKKA